MWVTEKESGSSTRIQLHSLDFWAAKVRRRIMLVAGQACPVSVKLRKTRSEHNESGLPPKADIRADIR
jgi:hypothetical protein